MLDAIRIEAYGDRVPLKGIASISVRDRQTLAVSVYDESVRSPKSLLYHPAIPPTALWHLIAFACHLLITCSLQDLSNGILLCAFVSGPLSSREGYSAIGSGP